MSAELNDDDIVRLARIASASNNYSGGRWISAEFSRDDLVGFARAVIASLPSERPEAEDARDAARYRWLRENGAQLFYASADLEGDALDARVDAGMREQGHD